MKTAVCQGNLTHCFVPDSANREDVGVNESERRLATICRKSFLNLWSYPNPYKGRGKELCDLIAVFGNRILIFSDKHSKFQSHIPSALAWCRWHRYAVTESLKEVRTASNWIEKGNTPFVDAKCSKTLPISLPTVENMEIYRICIAGGATAACRQAKRRRSGSLNLVPKACDPIYNPETKSLSRGRPFRIGSGVERDPRTHVIDATAFGLIIQDVDTIADFVDYLDFRSLAFRSTKLAAAFGEEELLAYYLETRARPNPPFSELGPKQFLLCVDRWRRLQTNPQYVEKKRSDAISYVWDSLIERAQDRAGATDPNITGSYLDETLRPLAELNRFQRRAVSQLLSIALSSRSDDKAHFHISRPMRHFNAIYVIATFPKSTRDPKDDAAIKENMLRQYAEVVGYRDRSYKRVIAIGFGNHEVDTPTHIYVVDNSRWDRSRLDAAFELDKSGRFLRKAQYRTVMPLEYPLIHISESGGHTVISDASERNKPCQCGSRKKFKMCCARHPL